MIHRLPPAAPVAAAGAPAPGGDLPVPPPAGPEEGAQAQNQDHRRRRAADADPQRGPVQEGQQVPTEHQQPGGADVLIRQQVHLGVYRVPCAEGDLAQHLPLGHRRLHALLAEGDDPGDVPGEINVLGQQPLDLLGRVDLHRVLLLGEGHRHLSHQLVCPKHYLPLEAVKAPVVELDGLREALGEDGAVLQGDPLRPQHHAEEAAAAAGRAGYQTVPCGAGGPGFDALSPLVYVPVGAVAGDEVVGGVELAGPGDVGGRHLVEDGSHQGHEVRVSPGLLGDEVEVPGGGVVV